MEKKKVLITWSFFSDHINVFKKLFKNRNISYKILLDKQAISEKKLLKIESEFDNSESSETDNSESSETDNSDSDSVKEYDLQSIIKSIENLEKILEVSYNIP